MTLPDIAILWRQGEQFAAQQQWGLAKERFTAFLQQRPGHAGALLQLSYIESLSGHYRAAHQYAIQACQAKPTQEAVICELVARLRTFNMAAELDDCLQRLPPLQQVGIPLLVTCAAQLSYLNEQTRALELLDEAKRGDPKYPPTLLARAQVLMYLGRFDQAEADLRACLERAPEIAQGWWLLSRLRKQEIHNNHVQTIRQQLQRPGRNPPDMALLGYALHKELDDLGDHAAAWSALELGCRAKRSTLDYRVEESRALISALVDLPGVPATSAAVPGNRRIPIFIVGMHRSGTTLLEQLLDGHSDVKGAGELYDFTSQMRHATDYHCRGVIDSTIVERARGIDYAAIGAGYLKAMEWRLGQERFFTDKLPSNFLNIGFISRALPQAKILHMVRDPIETCFSNLRELFSDANPFSYDQHELAAYFLQYQRLMRQWHQVFPGRILDVDYAALTREPEPTLRRVAEFCGLAFEPAMLDLQQRKRGVATASAFQVRDRILARDQPKWLPYADHLRPMIGALKAGGP